MISIQRHRIAIWALALALMTVSAVLAAVAAPAWLILAMISVGAAVLATIEDPWRRALVVLLVVMLALTSSFDLPSSLPEFVKFAPVGLLILCTLMHEKSRIQFSNLAPQVRALLTILWCFVAYALLSTAWSTVPGASAVSALALGGLVYIIHSSSLNRWIFRARFRGDVRAATIVMLCGTLLSIVMNLAGVSNAVATPEDVGPEMSDEMFGRFQGIYPNPNQLGMMSALTFCLTLSMVFDESSGRGLTYSRCAWIIASLFPLWAVVQSESRTSLVAVVATAIWVTFRRGLYSFAWFAAASGLVFLIMLLSRNSLIFDALQRFTANEGGDLLNARGMVWEDAFRALEANPFGVGWAAAQIALEESFNLGYSKSGLVSVHNSYINVLYELGWASILLVIPLAMMLLAVIFMIPPRTSAGVAAISLAITGSLTHWTESAMFGIGQPYPYILWIFILGGVVANSTVDRDCYTDR